MEREALLATAPKGATFSQVLQKLQTGKISARPGGMKVIFDSEIELEMRERLLVILNDDVDDESLKDPAYTISFSAKDGTSINYEVVYNGEITRSSNGESMTPAQFRYEIEHYW